MPCDFVFRKFFPFFVSQTIRTFGKSPGGGCRLFRRNVPPSGVRSHRGIATAMQQFDALFTKYKRRFTLFADSYIHDMQLAEDIVTDAFMAYWEAFRQSPPAGINAPAYILTIVKNKCINELEHRKVHEKFVASSLTDAQWELRMQLASLRACEPDAIFTAEMEELVRRSLRKLPPKAQKVFTMSRLEGRSHREIAVELGLSVKSVEYYMNIALRTLRADMAGYVAALIFYLGR